MLKLACSALGEAGTFLDNKGQKTELKFTTSFHEEQGQSRLKRFNSLSVKQIQYIRNKMNIKIASQTFSSSVADAIEFMTRLSGNELSGCGFKFRCCHLYWWFYYPDVIREVVM